MQRVLHTCIQCTQSDSCPALRSWATAQTLPRVCSAHKEPALALLALTTSRPSLYPFPLFRTSGTTRVHSLRPPAHLLHPLDPLRSLPVETLIREPPLLPAAELPLVHELPLIARRSSSGSASRPHSREEAAIALYQSSERTHEMAETHTNGAAPASKTEWYAGATRFELELEVWYSIWREPLQRSNPPATHR